MHPLAVAAAGDEIGTFEIGEVARDLWIIGPERVGQKAYANLTALHQVEQAKACPVSEGREEKLWVEGSHGLILSHTFMC